MVNNYQAFTHSDLSCRLYANAINDYSLIVSFHCTMKLTGWFVASGRFLSDATSGIVMAEYSLLQDLGPSSILLKRRVAMFAMSGGVIFASLPIYKTFPAIKELKREAGSETAALFFLSHICRVAS